MAAFILYILHQAFLSIIFCRVLRCGPSPPVLLGLNCLPPRCMSVVCGLLETSGLIVLSRFPMVASGMRQMFRCLLVELRSFL